jgi:trehalose 6-phosphate synthase/phosphatase
MKPQDAKPSARLIQLLTQLTADPRNSVYVISGRDKEFLEANLGQVPGLGMSAEHGCFNKASPRDSHNKDSPRPEWENFAKNFDDSWRVRFFFVFFFLNWRAEAKSASHHLLSKTESGEGDF